VVVRTPPLPFFTEKTMRIEEITFTVRYKVFDVGEKVKPTSPRCSLEPGENVEHSYILTTDPPTEFCVQPFFLKHLDESKHNFFLEFDKQAKESNIYQCLPNHLYLIDPYMVHRTPRLPGDTSRTFLRITFAFTELQHPKNTINPLFAGQEYEKRIDIRENLCKNEFDVPYHLYGVQHKE
jgi:hypothetical protein